MTDIRFYVYKNKAQTQGMRLDVTSSGKLILYNTANGSTWTKIW